LGFQNIICAVKCKTDRVPVIEKPTAVLLVRESETAVIYKKLWQWPIGCCMQLYV